MKTTLVIIIATILMLNVSAQTLKINSEKAQVSFNYEKEKTTGTIGGIDAKIIFNINDLSKATIEGTADVSTLSTSNKKRDDHLKSDDYFKMAKYPKMKFKSTSIDKNETGYIMKGLLTIVGIEKEIAITFTYENSIFEGVGVLYLNDFGVFKQKKYEDSKVALNIIIPIL